MTRIDIPKFAHEQALVDAENASRRTRLHPDSSMNELMRKQKDDRDRTTEARVQPKVAKILGQHEPDEPEDAPDVAALRAQATADREEAARLQRQAESLRRLHG
jgi:hypothetical protein